MWQAFFHYSNHFVVIFIIAWFYSPRDVWKAYLILLSTMLVDVDHLWASPIFDPNRCSVGFHTFHSEIAIVFYILGMFLIKHKWIKLVCIGLVFHMITDGMDCVWSSI
ncbi:DUF6122 family protein [Psychroflexus tropicus]|uniref:DUF6122 family protein n=1 Tax=Psychroflexus tropicus TaxID=197345 RepID=UPI00037390DC|nr:DUF6122 family protein [Psychroflexus tropicus]